MKYKFKTVMAEGRLYFDARTVLKMLYDVSDALEIPEEKRAALKSFGEYLDSEEKKKGGPKNGGRKEEGNKRTKSV